MWKLGISMVTREGSNGCQTAILKKKQSTFPCLEDSYHERLQKIATSQGEAQGSATELRIQLPEVVDSSQDKPRFVLDNAEDNVDLLVKGVGVKPAGFIVAHVLPYLQSVRVGSNEIEGSLD